MKYKIMTPGPTMVRENVRLARSLECTNPDLDEEFVDFYKETCRLLSDCLHTPNETYILGGEGILGLEAACASLTEHGDKVLVLDNGIYGNGFADFVSMYGGVPTLYTAPYDEAIDLVKLREYLVDNHDFKYATIVHCDTPSGMLNPAEDISILLHEYNIMTVVDSVSAMFGEPLDVSRGKFDIVCGGSQKALSAPPGLTFVNVSPQAMKTMEERNTPIASFYANILVFKNYYEEKWFPYTMPISDIYGLRAAIDNFVNDTDCYERHAKVAKYTRNRLIESGLKLYGKNGYSNTVTAVCVPDGFGANEILRTLREKYGIMIAGSFGVFENKLLRIGHMGEGANMDDVTRTVDALLEIIGQTN